MAMTLSFTFEGKAYELAFTRNSVRTMEATGFNAEELFTKPMTMVPKLFEGAFMANHKGIKHKDIDRIYDALTNRSELIGKLVEMYRETVTSLMTDEEGEDEGNVSWTANF